MRTCAHQVFLNIVLDEAVEEKAGGEKVRIGMVVCLRPSLRWGFRYPLQQKKTKY